MSTLLSISQLGHPVLRGVAKEVENIKDPVIQTLIDDMIDTCEDAGGFGISAPQVYQPLRLFTMSSKPSPRFPNAPLMAPTAIINPVLISASEEIEKGWEGCLSIPGIRGFVPRPKSIKVSFTDREGNKQERDFEGLPARVFQHELDHLNGVVFLDRVDVKEIVTEKEYQKIMAELGKKK